MTVPTPALRRLARQMGTLTTYRDALGNDRSPSAETLMAVLQTLGVNITSPDQADELLDMRRDDGARLAAPVIVVWDGASTTIETVAAERLGPVEATLVLETGETVELFSSSGADAPGLQFLSTPEGLPLGYHELHLRAGRIESKSTVLCAPRVAWTDPRHRWIGFLPLYALHSERNPGVANLADLAELGAWLKELGDGLVGTLPLLAGFLEQPLIEPSPYAPISRLAWNEMYVDTGQGGAAPNSSGGSRGRLIDYEQAYAGKRRTLSEGAGAAFVNPESKAAMERFADTHFGMADYCRFRAASAIIGEPWYMPAEQM